MELNNAYNHYPFPVEMTNCTLCPRNCNANRTSGRKGYCNAGADMGVASVCVHHGEEPAISGVSGICNVFFGRCNLQCIYCQNTQISTSDSEISIPYSSLSQVTGEICRCLDSGCKAVGFVSPTHMLPQMKMIIQALKDMGRNPTIVYNSNAYDKVEMLREIESLIDVYLPDFKYSDNHLAKTLSGAGDYFEVSRDAIKEMLRQKGPVLITDENGEASSGLIIRHLVLPGMINNSLGVLRCIANELSPRIHISLMSQYHPMPAVANHPLLGCELLAEEYLKVQDEMEILGFENGWIQELESSNNYLPNFCQEHPFEHKLELTNTAL